MLNSNIFGEFRGSKGGLRIFHSTESAIYACPELDIFGPIHNVCLTFDSLKL